MDVPITFVALAFGLHIAMVNLGIALATLVPYFKWRAEKLGNNGLLKAARSLMKFYAATYALAGVFGTAFTVFLLSFYPKFIGLAGHLTFVPFGLAILFIALHFLTITTYWYGWNHLSRQTHLAVGILMAISSYIIPLGFRAVFAFLNTPIGLKLDPSGKPYLDVLEALSNPTLLPLYLKSIVGALTVGFLVMAGAFSYKYFHSSEEERRAAEELVRFSTLGAIITLIAMVLLGTWYGFSLMIVEYKFNNIFGAFGWTVGDGVIHQNYGWLFAFKITLVALQFIIVLYIYGKLRGGSFINLGQAKLLMSAGTLSLIVLISGELLNEYSQYPYFVADLTDPKIASALPEPVKQLLVDALVIKPNVLATGSELIMLTLGFLGALLVAAAFFIYLILLAKPKIEEEY